jgi:hypothetical protein
MALLVLAPGVLVAVGCFLPLVSASVSIVGVSGTGNIAATDTTVGKVALVLAFVAVLLDALDLRGGERRYRGGTTALAVLAALLVAYKGWSVQSQFDSVAVSQIAVHASIGIGVWVALLGGLAGSFGRWLLVDA